MADIFPTIPVQVETRKNVLVSYSRTGLRQVSVKSPAVRFYTLDFKNRDQDEYEEYLQDWDSNYPDNAITWANTDLNASGQFLYDSELKASVGNPEWFDFNFTLRNRDGLSPSNPGSTTLTNEPNFVYDITNGKRTLINDSIGMGRAARATSISTRQYLFTFNNRSLAEAVAAENFWNWHYPKNVIQFHDCVFDEDLDFWFDSNFKWTIRGVNLVDYSFVLTEAITEATPLFEGVDPSAYDESASGWWDGQAESFNGAMSNDDPVGDTVSRWQNRLNNAQYFANGSPSTRPVFHSSGGPNNAPFVSFDQQTLALNLAASAIIDADGYTIFLVIKQREDPDGNYILGSGPGYWGLRTQTSGGNVYEHIKFVDNPLIFDSVYSTTYDLDEWYIVELRKDPTTSYIKINDQPEMSVDTENIVSLLDAFFIGINSVTQKFDLAGMYTFDDGIGVVERDAFRSALNTEFDVY